MTQRSHSVQAYLILLHFTLLHFADMCLLQIKDKILHQQEDHNSLYCGFLDLNPQYL